MGLIPLLDKQDEGYYPMTDTRHYYRDDTGSGGKFSANFPDLLTAYLRLEPDKHGRVDIEPEDGTYYFVDGDVELKNDSASNVVIFSTGQITVGTGVNLNGTVPGTRSRNRSKGPA